MNIIKWAIRNIKPNLAVNGQFAELGNQRNPPKELYHRINAAYEYYPCDVLFIHRDAEKESLEMRVSEIEDHMRKSTAKIPVIFVIPVRMMETWLLINGDAIKKAAGNRKFSGDLDIPSIGNLETIPDPKRLLHDLIYTASEKKGRAKSKLNVHKAVHLVSDNIADFSPLLNVPAFVNFYNSLAKFLKSFD
jgi:hypothetical protein